MQRKGFSLIELLVVCLIIGVLSSLALPNYNRSIERARVTEALTMLRAIHDSCERLAIEHFQTGCEAGISSGIVTFPKLDMTVKGTFSNNGLTLTTENFIYTLGEDISATPVKGNYVGAIIKLDNNNFVCTDGTSGQAATACATWGSSTWNN